MELVILIRSGWRSARGCLHRILIGLFISLSRCLSFRWASRTLSSLLACGIDGCSLVAWISIGLVGSSSPGHVSFDDLIMFYWRLSVTSCLFSCGRWRRLFSLLANRLGLGLLWMKCLCLIFCGCFFRGIGNRAIRGFCVFRGITFWTRSTRLRLSATVYSESTASPDLSNSDTSSTNPPNSQHYSPHRQSQPQSPTQSPAP